MPTKNTDIDRSVAFLILNMLNTLNTSMDMRNETSTPLYCTISGTVRVSQRDEGIFFQPITGVNNRNPSTLMDSGAHCTHEQSRVTAWQPRFSTPPLPPAPTIHPRSPSQPDLELFVVCTLIKRRA